MASNPPFGVVEDQTDEDFFDKLVDDEFGASSSATAPNVSGSQDFDEAKAFPNVDNDPDNKQVTSSLNDDSDDTNMISTQNNDSDYAKGLSTLDNDLADVQAFASLSVGDADGEGGNEVKKEPSGTEAGVKLPGVVDVEESNSVVLSNSVGFDSVNQVKNDVRGTEVVADSVKSKDDGSGVKVVGWSSFYSDSAQNGNDDFGSEFFNELGDKSGDFPGNLKDNVNGATDNVLGNEHCHVDSLSSSGNENCRADSLSSSVNNAQYQEHQAYVGHMGQSNDAQDLDHSQYWENQYPGWTYDQSTGQWYQVDDYDLTSNGQVSYDASTSTSDWAAVADGNSDISYLQQTAPSINKIVSNSSTTETVSKWNQVQQLNNGYPEHMIFDPRYPGWYYDSITGQWCSLDSYIASVQSTGQFRDQQGQNTYTDAFRHSNDNLNSGQSNNFYVQGSGSQGQKSSWNGTYDGKGQHDMNVWQPQTVAEREFNLSFSSSQLVNDSYTLKTSKTSEVSHHNSYSSFGAMPSDGEESQNRAEANGSVRVLNSAPNGNFSQPINMSQREQNKELPASNYYNGSMEAPNINQPYFPSGQQFPCVSSIERSPDRRPGHALVSFGFGGKLLIVKDNSLGNSSYGSQAIVGDSISVLNLSEVVKESTETSGAGIGACDYFDALCEKALPGPLGGGSVGTKELYRWIDERIANCESPDRDYRKGKVLKLLLSLLKIGCQHYGKFRSPFGTDTTLRENDIPETAVARLFASAKKEGVQFNAYGALNNCVQNFPSEAQIRATASEVQNLLVSGRKREALQCAQEGQLWGPALVLASQLGDQFYVDTVKQMALHQLVAGSPLRTLCLLIAGQPADVFTPNSIDGNFSSSMDVSQQHGQYGANSVLDDWEENFAMITANRTKDDELVIIHLGDSLWKERNEITAAHICYLVAEANFESCSDSARLCLVGADHWKYPRTYASPEAIQRTELYEYSKVLGNSQFILLPFQPYKLIYAHMLAEVGKVSDSLKYCQAVLKFLKTGRAPEVETWKQLASSLEERIKIHQQSGYTANPGPKIVDRILNFFDSTAHKVVGGLPPPAPSTSQGNAQQTQALGKRVSASRSTMAMSSLIPSASTEPISEWSADGNRRGFHTRSVSEPDFSRTPRQVDSSNEPSPSDVQDKASGSDGASRSSRFGFGSKLLKRTVGLVWPRSGQQAKLGEQNKFYYDEKLKRWVEEGAEPPAEEAALPPPPTTAAFQNGMSNYHSTPMIKSESTPTNSSTEFINPSLAEHSSGVPPVAPSSNQFAARGRMGVRARYVDTFNKGGGTPPNLFSSPSVSSIKPTVAANAKFFIPTPMASAEQMMEATTENIDKDLVNSEAPLTSNGNNSVDTHVPSPPLTMQRFPSMNNIASQGPYTNYNHSLPSHSRRTASWGGSLDYSYGPDISNTKPPEEASGMSSPSAYIPSGPESLHTPSNSGSYGNDLQEVEL